MQAIVLRNFERIEIPGELRIPFEPFVLVGLEVVELERERRTARKKERSGNEKEKARIHGVALAALTGFSCSSARTRSESLSPGSAGFGADRPDAG